MKVHFVAVIDPEYGNGWSDCGILIPAAFAYEEEGNDRITCKRCQARNRLPSDETKVAARLQKVTP